jgi:serine/threonine-protein kinase
MTNLPTRLTTALAGRYRIDRELGAGGMATVYLAQDLRHDRLVAVKVLRPELAAVIGAARFLAEIKTTAALQHPHILPLFDSGLADSFPFYVMPYVRGESLRDRLRREKQLPVVDAVRIAREVASALDYAHRHHVIHRDIKPENVLLHDGQALVTDFGIALAVSKSGDSRMTETGMSLGTPHYMSPEQAMGDREITARSDVYALGAMTYEMLVGEPPFTGPTAQSIVAKVLTAEPARITAQRRTVPPEVEAAVLTALEKLPADRFASAAEFSDALTDSRETEGRRTRTGAREPAAVWTARRSTQVLVGVAALATLLALWGWLRPMPSRAVSSQRIVLGLKGGASASGFGAALSPDGETIAFSDTAGGVAQLWSKDRNQVDATPLSGTTGSVGAPFFSPDGKWLALVTRDGSLLKVPRHGGTATTLAVGANAGSPAGAWLANGTILFNNRDYGLSQVADTGGLVRSPTGKAIYGVVAMSALPGSRGALFTVCSAYCATSIATWVIDMPSGTAQKLLDETVRAWYLPDGRLIYVRRDGGVYIARLNLGTHTVAGLGTPVVEGVRTDELGIAFLQLSASGTFLYAKGQGVVWGPSRILWVDRTGAATVMDPAWSPIVAPGTSVAIAPGGRALAFTIQSDAGTFGVWVKELDRGPATRLTPDGVGNISTAWTPDGGSLTFLGDSGRTLWIRPADGSDSARRLLHQAGTILDATWSRDGRWLVGSSSDTAGGRRLWVLRPGTDTVSRPLVETGVNMWGPALSPDGRWLAYVSDESGRPEVYVRPFPNANAGKWPVSKDGGQEPVWAHNGRELFYRVRPEFSQPGDPVLMVAKVVTVPTFSIVRQLALFRDSFRGSLDRRFYDVSADDRRFLMVDYLQKDRSTSPLNLVLTENWVR